MTRPDDPPDRQQHGPGGPGGCQALRERLTQRYGRAGQAAYGLMGCLVALALSGLVAHRLRQPLLFPSLGPTALLFFEQPRDPESSPYNAVAGHLVAIAAGVASIAVLGLWEAPSVLDTGITWSRAASGTLSLALVAAVLPPLRAAHPPAGATTLLISLGMLDSPSQLVAIGAGVTLLTVVAWSLNRLAGTRVPVVLQTLNGRTHRPSGMDRLG